MTNDMENEFKILKATIADDGSWLEVEFQSKRDATRMVTRLTPDTWLKGTWAEIKLAEFHKSLTHTIKILEGRR